MARKNNHKCPDCGGPCWTRRGTTYGRCEQHQKAYWNERARSRRTNPKKSARAEDPARQRIVVIDPDTNRAKQYEVIGLPALFIVPEDNAEFARQLKLARERGVIVAFSLRDAKAEVDDV